MSEFRITASGTAVPPRRCLFGVTMLLIEDSRAASEAIRLFAIESGARLRRADSLASAHRHLAIYRPNVVIVDLGLPDGSGLQLIEALAGAPAPFSAIIALSGNEPGTWEASAIDAGADSCLAKPVTSLRAFQNTVLALLPDRGVQPALGPDMQIDGDATLAAAIEADLSRALALLEEAVPQADAETIAYCAQFLGSLNRSEADAALAAAAQAAEGADAIEGGAGLIVALRRRLGPRAALRGAA